MLIANKGATNDEHINVVLSMVVKNFILFLEVSL